MKRRRSNNTAIVLGAGVLIAAGAAYLLTRTPSFSPELERELLAGGPGVSWFPAWLALWEMGVVKEMPRAGDTAFNLRITEEGLRAVGVPASGELGAFCRAFSAKIQANTLQDAPTGSAAMNALVASTHGTMVRGCAAVLVANGGAR